MPDDGGLPRGGGADPDTISGRIEEAQRRVPINECFLLIPQGIHDRDKILTSLELFATRVMPRFR